MFKIRTLNTISLRTRGGFPVMRRVILTWPGLIRRYHNGQDGMMWCEWVEE